MAQFNDAELKAIKAKNDEDGMQQFLKGCYTKIVDGIRALPKRSVERAVWELVQNARDLCVKTDSGFVAADIRITLKKDSFVFEHKGHPFDFDSLSSLVKQVSSHDKEDGDKVGQYGTGFMTTHKFSRKVYIKGDYEVTFGDRVLYAPLMDYRDPENIRTFCLDRTSDDVTTFKRELYQEILSIDELPKYANTDKRTEWTTFEYPIVASEKDDYYNGIRKTLRLVPYVMAFNDLIHRIEIVDEEKDVTMYYSRYGELKREPMMYDACTYIRNNTIEVRKNGCCQPNILVQTLENSDGSNRIVIPPLPVGYDDVSTIPSQFLFFPLLGKEIWGTNFIYHSSNVWATEKRDSYQLPVDNPYAQPRYECTKEVLLSMDEMLFAYYRNMPQMLDFVSREMGRVCFADEAESDCVTQEFLRELQERWSNEVVNWAIIPTEDGRRKITEEKVAVLDRDMYCRLDEESQRIYEPILAYYASKVKTIPNENLIAWSKTVYQWNSKESSFYIQLDDICKAIVEKDEHLRAFLELLVAIDKGDCFKQHKLIPNREGALQTSEFLRDAKDIGEELYKIVRPIIGSVTDRFIATEYVDICQPEEYSRKSLKADVATILGEWKAQRKDELGAVKPMKQWDVENETTHLLDLIAYCSAFYTIVPGGRRAQLMPLICELYGVNYECRYNPRSVSEDANSDIYETAFAHLLEDTLLWLSQQKTDWVAQDSNRKLLLQIVTILHESDDKTILEFLQNYALFPNRKYEMCLASALKCSLISDSDLIDVCEKILGVEIMSEWVLEEFVALASFQEETGRSLGNRVETKLEEGDYQDRNILTIIRQLHNNNWKDFFKAIDADKGNLQYRLGGKKMQDSIYKLQMQDDNEGNMMARLAELADKGNLLEVVNKAESIIEQEKDRKRDLEFKCAIGKAIEEAIRNQLKGDLTFDPKDVQNGQDMIIYKNGEPVFYLEVKSKWNFDKPAYMSHNQVIQAVKERKHYALLCVDCRQADAQLQYGGGCGISPDATEEVIQQQMHVILQHTWAHMDIGDKLEPLLEGIITALDGDEESTVKVDGDFSGRIPLKVFVKGDSYEVFIQSLTHYLNSL